MIGEDGRQQLRELAAKIFNVPPDVIVPDLRAGMIATWDSLGHLLLFMAVQEHWKIKFTTEEIVDNSSLEDISRLIVRKLNP